MIASLADSIDDPIVKEQVINQRAALEDRRDMLTRLTRQVVVFTSFIVALGFGYTGYKALGQAIDDKQHDWWGIGSVLPRTDDLNMPPLLDILAAFDELQAGTGRVLGRLLFEEAVFTLREAVVGFAIGTVVGFAIALVLARWKPMERAFLPYVIGSQTVPLIAIAPIIIIWGRKNFGFMPWEWQDWMSVSIIAAFLTFFPVAVNGLRGLQSPKPENLELMESFAATWTETLWRLRLPASLPYLFAALKIAATASIVGAIVGEISAGVGGGLGRRILLEAQRYTTGPERLYASVIGSAILGILVFLAITGAERLVLGRQGREAIT